MKKRVVIEVDNLSFRYDNELILSNISFSVEEGDFVGMIGPNGAGKTTLAKILLGMLRPSGGSIKMADDVTMGYVPQRYSLDRNFPATVKELLESNSSSFWPIVHELEISDLLSKRFVDLSGGQQQRVMIAIALVLNPKVLMLDEPDVGVDIKAQEGFYKFLNKLNKKGITIIIISHDVGIIAKYAKSVLCINKSLSCHGPVSKMSSFVKNVYGEEFRIYHHHAEHKHD